jgi:ribosomal protein S18 acetylase RimI-like enzyme
MAVTIRPAKPDDDAALAAIDRATWSEITSPAPPPPPDRTFFDGRCSPEDVIVAELDGRVAGYVQLARPTPVPAGDHVLQIAGLAVDPGAQGRGVGRALVEAAAAEATRRGARRLTLRVLGENEPARRLYAACGFVVEGVLSGEFHLGGVDVDDVLMARRLAPAVGPTPAAPSDAVVS